AAVSSLKTRSLQPMREVFLLPNQDLEIAKQLSILAKQGKDVPVVVEVDIYPGDAGKGAVIFHGYSELGERPASVFFKSLSRWMQGYPDHKVFLTLENGLKPGDQAQAFFREFRDIFGGDGILTPQNIGDYTSSVESFMSAMHRTNSRI